MTKIIDNHPKGDHPFATSLIATDETTVSGKPHRVLIENGHNDIFLKYMIPAVQDHHISLDALERRKDLIKSFNMSHLSHNLSPYPQDSKTQKGNFAEVFLTEYLGATTTSQLPIYRLRYNTNPDQSMKGDDVLLFDLDSSPVRIIVGESKFRKTPDKYSVIEMVDGLVRSDAGSLPVSLMFVADRLFEENKPEIGEKVQECALLFSTNKLQIDYVGLLMSNHNAKNLINKHTPNNLNNLLMISLGIRNPEEVIKETFSELEKTL